MCLTERIVIKRAGAGRFALHYIRCIGFSPNMRSAPSKASLAVDEVHVIMHRMPAPLAACVKWCLQTLKTCFVQQGMQHLNAVVAASKHWEVQRVGTAVQSASKHKGFCRSGCSAGRTDSHPQTNRAILNDEAFLRCQLQPLSTNAVDGRVRFLLRYIITCHEDVQPLHSRGRKMQMSWWRDIPVIYVAVAGDATADRDPASAHWKHGST